jgi:uncharacterized membrane protein YbhN (UPF0104 family)
VTGLLEHLRELVATIAAADARWVLLALVFQLGNLCARSLAWRNVLAAAFPLHRLRVFAIGRAYAIGVGLNGWLPARAGDASKIALVRAEHPGTNAVGIASGSVVLVAFDSLVAVLLVGAAVASGAVPVLPLADVASRVQSSLPLVAGVLVLLAVFATFVRRRAGARTRSAGRHAREGLAIVGTPGRWLRTVASVQLLAWSCRITVVYCMLVAFGIPATPQLAALVVVVGGMSTLVPVPGGAGTQQALAAVALAGVASPSEAIAFSIAMQLGVTAVNTSLAIVAAMISFGHLHPGNAIRAAMAAARSRVPDPVADPLPDPVT